jgi:pyruvate/2-oxoglutarate dehydrogenase complex dihydrolipoamide dehydrogenase (E3) component
VRVWTARKFGQVYALHDGVSRPSGVLAGRISLPYSAILMQKDFDFVVLGGGSAGYAAARTAVAAGLRVAVVDGAETLGGLCILRGCMPSKTLLESAKRFRTLRRAEEFGLAAERISFSADRIRERKEKLIGEFATYRQEQLTQGNFALIRGTASFISPHEIHINLREGGGQTLRSRYFLVATGSVINSPPVPGLEQPGVWTSDTQLATAAVPASVIVLGAGPVALEAASYYSGLGSRVTLINRSAGILTGSDSDVSTALAAGLREERIDLITGTKLERIERDGALFVAHFSHEGQSRSVAAAALFNGLGRRPCTDGLALPSAEVETDKRGTVQVQSTQQTSAAHIFAAGDVCGPYEIVHLAINQGEVAARNAARLLRGEGEALETMDYRLKLFAVFTEPQLATAGATEEELSERGLPFLTATHPFADHGKSMVRGETHGFVKLTAHARTGEILGAAVVGPEASELIHETVVAMRFRATVHQFATIPHYHPTLSEIWSYPAEELAERCGKDSIALP